MSILIDLCNNLLVASFVIQLLAIIFVFNKNNRTAMYSANIVLLVGLTLGLASTLSSALFSSAEISTESIFLGYIRLDALSLYFLFIVQLVAIPTTIYNFSYLQHYVEKKDQ